MPATGVTTSSATLNGTVNPTGWPTTAWFQWGATTNYGNLTLVTNLGSGTTASPLSAPLAGLTPSVTYHFRVAATNDYGLVYGSDQSFTTLGAPQVSTLPATGVSTNSATLNGTVNPIGWSTAAWFQWGTTTSYGNLTAVTNLGSGTTALPFSAPVAGLALGATYHFRFAATNYNGMVYGSDQSFTTLAPPAQVSTLPATGVSPNSATLNGTVNPNGWPTTAWFQWGTTTSYGNLTSTTALGSGTTALPLSAPLAGLTLGVTYHFRIAATNDNGLVYGSDQSFTTLAPPQVSTLPATGVSSNSATLNGTVNPTGWPTAAWFQWGTTTSYGNLTSVADLGSGTTALPLSAPLAGLTLGVTYHFRIAATSDYGLVYGSDQSFTTLGLPQAAGDITILHSFPDGPNDGSGSGYDSCFSNGSMLYGSTESGGAHGCGSLFGMQLDGTQYQNIYSFSQADEVFPSAWGLVLDGSTFFGTSLSAGANGWGAIYRIQTNGTGFQLLHSFTRTNGDGAQMYSGVVPAGSRLYGTAVIGGINDNGIVFSLNKDGSDYQILHAFTNGPDGWRPYGAPTVSGTTLYGMSSSSIYRMNLDGSGFAVLQSGVGGIGRLTLSGSALYGIAGDSVFRMDTDGSNYQVLHELDGESQSGLALVGSTLYGFTRWGGSADEGTIFSINTDGSGYQLLHSFLGGSNDGVQPLSDPVVIESTLYGRAAGGPNGGGIIFSLTVPSMTPPWITSQPLTQTAEAGSAVDLWVEAIGSEPLFYLWYLNATNLISCSTNCDFELTNVDFSQSGAYTVVVSNLLGAVTSAPAVLSVIAPVERRPVPGVKVTGEAGSLVNVNYADSLSPAPNWTTLGSVSLTTTSQYYFDLTLPLPPQRFYRAWQTGAPGVIPSLDLHLVPAITVIGSIGGSVRVDAINQFGPIDAWFTLDTVTLTNTSQLYFDVSAWQQPQRLYRLVRVP